MPNNAYKCDKLMVYAYTVIDFWWQNDPVCTPFFTMLCSSPRPTLLFHTCHYTKQIAYNNRE